MTGLGLADPERENTLLVRIIEAISAGPELSALAAKVADLIVSATNTDVCFVHVLDDRDSALVLAGATAPFDAAAGRVRLPLGEGIAGWAASHGEPVVVAEGKEDDPRYRYFPELRGEDYTSMASVPMSSSPGGLAGVLNVHTRVRREFTDRDVRLLTTIGSLLAGAVHQARTHRRLAARERAHERFTEQVIAAQETERRRLAGDIHDGITQRLVSLRFHLEAALDPEFAAEQLVKARELADLTLDEARAAVSGLRPPVLDDLGLADSLASLARSTAELAVETEIDECRLPEHTEVALYRIAQEALQNVIKHAGTGAATLTLRRTDRGVLLRVRDRGRGFDRDTMSFGDDRSSGYGMTSMAERAELIGGRLEVSSSPENGTTVSVTVPVA
ncbi:MULTISPECIES: GAF domain-containing sensor histidine kinase [Amycolatopsis]|uniref:Oxygen sensor histidine kinase NreB n=1 Tax=Amycolatopsis echigonensis TaxID=2576905 RepID=A0A2N3WP75_9PSEU|nr:GAF domain-containing sensor histidine kinase [Amycolatopsis niigatensis]PKV95671.1 signal transduction histidine kinase [Amycolatopsis niigatensis]